MPSAPGDAPPPDAAPIGAPGLDAATVAIFAVSCGAMVANIYYAQSLIGLIAPDLHLHESAAGLVVTLTQVGYGAGLFLLVSLADLVENRRLILLTTAGVVAGLLLVATSTSAATFLLGSFLAGFCSVGAQILVPLAAHLTPESRRGRVIGNVMGGLIAGIMLARPAASFLASQFGWRAIFWVSAVLMLGIMLLLWRRLAQRRPQSTRHYGGILTSTLALVVEEPLLRRRAAYQGALFAVFNLFWTAAPLMLHDRFGLTQKGIALFALAGAGGALAAPLIGRLADRGLTRALTGLAMLTAILSLLAAGWSAAAGAMAVLAVTAILLDAATQANHIVSQRAIYGLSAEARGRLNAAYMTLLFLCGAAGSALAPLAYHHGGWRLAMGGSALLVLAALALFATERRPAR
ncbi:MFS transporter [Roseomonas sp. OT10]|uniref:MFS transporter n=1 Tax=Roseomonas cutis TaxID=2897332 RepID=UPI001E4CF3A9|nr:MFS transporter [Roseomonas sp. OT10]UFN50302.1 MFS transporter [Roseomonas sp. OT10]